MTELDDELEALRRANPVDQASMPSSTSPEAEALYDRITASAVDSGLGSTRDRRRTLAAAAAVIVLALAGGAVALVGGGDGEPATTTQVALETTTSTSAGGGPITPGGAASCVEHYSLETLQRREAAFDATVVSVEGDVITFRVNEWYRGGEGDSTTRRGADVVGAITSAGPSVSLEPGTRLLVAGDDDFAWSCGFTQPYDADVAAQWAGALRG